MYIFKDLRGMGTHLLSIDWLDCRLSHLCDVRLGAAQASHLKPPEKSQNKKL